jgi:regulator of nucleoside diphosphate kinase
MSAEMHPAYAAHPPPVHVVEDEYERLSDIVCASPRETEAIALLWRELERAAIVPPDQAPEDLVRMHSVVGFTDLLTGARGTARLAYPVEDKPGATDVSVASTLGAALIGLRAGSIFAWTSVEEGARLIRIDTVDASSPGDAAPQKHSRRRRRYSRAVSRQEAHTRRPKLARSAARRPHRPISDLGTPAFGR